MLPKSKINKKNNRIKLLRKVPKPKRRIDRREGKKKCKKKNLINLNIFKILLIKSKLMRHY